jgi:pantetheine-phosphate adenylyltransferase
MNTAPVFAGSFDPFTKGHLDIAERAHALFGAVVVLVAVNSKKQGFLPLAERMARIQKALAHLPNATVDSWEGLTVDYLRAHGLHLLVRGIRNASDLEMEQAMAWNNQKLMPKCETVFLSARQEHLAISSSLVRELEKNGARQEYLAPFVVG